MGFTAIFVPNFMVQAAERAEPALRARALALIEGAPPLWSVAAVNEAARKAGIETGMTKSQVEQFRGIEIRQRLRGQEKAAHAALLDLGWSISPRVEDVAPDAIVIDIAGLGSLFGTEQDIAREMEKRARGLGLTAQIAAAETIDVAILAARGFAGVTVIPAGEEAKRIGCLPVGVLSPPEEILEIFDRWGIYTCEALAALPVAQLSERLGQEGVRLHELARGESVRSLALAEPEIHFEEEMELEDAVEELEPLSFLLGRLLDQLCARLAARALAVCTVRVRFELDTEDSDRASGVKAPDKKPAFMSDLKVRPPKNRNRIYERLLSLPVPVRDSKMLLSLLRLHLQSDPPTAPILKIVLAAEPARPRVSQGELYLPSSPDPEKLELTVARLANLVGDAHVGSAELVDTHRPGEFRMRRFVPPGDRASFGTDEPRKLRPTRTGFRVFRTAVPANVELREGCPVRVGFRGMRGEVVTASGPWRSSGDWWREDFWHNDEWDLEIRFDGADASRREEFPNGGVRPSVQHGVYRIFYDSVRQGWFVRGMYD